MANHTPTTCTVDECHTSKIHARGLCRKHYFRWYRHGDPLQVWDADAKRPTHGRRYKSTRDRGHLLATADGLIWEHRLVLFDKIGHGPHRCHWCHTHVNWKAEGDHTLQVDHVNHIGDDNDPGNLVPCCRSCNVRRAVERKAEANAGQWWNGSGAANVLATLGR